MPSCRSPSRRSSFFLCADVLFHNDCVGLTNDIFAANAWYFRNALVRANYTNLKKNVHETTEYLERFLRNLLLDEQNELHNRNLHISRLLENEKVDIGTPKVDIGAAKVDIGAQKVDIERVLSEKGK